MADANLLATDLADYLVTHGVPFRSAHEVIGKAVAVCQAKNVTLRELSLAEYRALSPAFQADLFDALDLDRAMAARRAAGAPSPANVAAQLAAWQARLAPPPPE